MKTTIILLAAALSTAAFADTVKQGTAVPLAFDEPLSSKTAKPGDRVKMHVTKEVKDTEGNVVVKEGTVVWAVISDVSKRGRFGKNGKIRLTLNPVEDVNGHHIPLQPRQKGNEFKGNRTDKAALASGAGAIVLGPVGLVGGYFVPGKEVNVKVGDPLVSEVAKTVKS